MDATSFLLDGTIDTYSKINPPKKAIALMKAEEPKRTLDEIKVSQRLKQIRETMLYEDSKASIDDLAEALNMNRSVVYSFEAGTRMPNINYMVKLAQKLHINPTWLLLGIGPERLNLSEYKGLSKKFVVTPVISGKILDPKTGKKTWKSKKKEQ